MESNCKKKSKQIDDPDTRKCAVKSLGQIVKTVGISTIGGEDITKIFNLIFKTINDYSKDKRGDIGLFVREASMYTLLDLLALAGDYLITEEGKEGNDVR